MNAPPDLPASHTPVGPTLAPEELAGHKLLALFDRAAAWDFAVVYVLAHTGTVNPSPSSGGHAFLPAAVLASITTQTDISE